VTVLGNRTLTTNPATQNYGAVAIKPVSTNGSSGEGSMMVTSLNGRIIASDRAFDFANRFNGRNEIALSAKGDIELSVTSVRNAGSASNAKAVVSSQGGNAGTGGSNALRSFSGGIAIGEHAQVLADIAGTPGVNGSNALTSCVGVVNAGAVVPADADTGDDSGSCVPPAPDSILEPCAVPP
jgi:hypothetical protein